jgi:hypothetical protein
MKDNSTKLYKIGLSNDVEKREKTLQSEKPTIELLSQKEFPNRMDASMAEKALHCNFGEFRVRGEWFDLGQSEIEDIIAYFSLGKPLVQRRANAIQDIRNENELLRKRNKELETIINDNKYYPSKKYIRAICINILVAIAFAIISTCLVIFQIQIFADLSGAKISAFGSLNGLMLLFVTIFPLIVSSFCVFFSAMLAKIVFDDIKLFYFS